MADTLILGLVLGQEIRPAGLKTVNSISEELTLFLAVSDPHFTRLVTMILFTQLTQKT